MNDFVKKCLVECCAKISYCELCGEEFDKKNAEDVICAECQEEQNKEAFNMKFGKE